MSEYTPTDAEVREDFAYPWEGFVQDRPGRLAAFDRWLAAHDAKVKAEVLRAEADEWSAKAKTIETMYKTPDDVLHQATLAVYRVSGPDPYSPPSEREEIRAAAPIITQDALKAARTVVGYELRYHGFHAAARHAELALDEMIGQA